HQDGRQQGDEALGADQGGALAAPVHLDLVGVQRCDRAVLRLVKGDSERHELAGMEGGRPAPLPPARGEQFLLPARRKRLPQVVDRTEAVEYTPAEILLGLSIRW